jgi:ketosteroid isomerase-like protein
MKTKRKIMNCVFVVPVLIMFISGCNQQPVDVTEQIKLANNDFMTAVSNGDTNQLHSLYTQDAKLFPSNNSIIEGKEQIIGFWDATMKMGIKKVQFETTNAQGFGNIAIEEGEFRLFVAGDVLVDEGKYIVTWKKEGGKWKVYRDIWNASTPAVQARTAADSHIMIVLNHIKADKVAQFEDFYRNYLAVAGAEYFPETKKTVRVQKPVQQNEDGTYTYIFLMDPIIESGSYDMGLVLSAKYGNEKAVEYLNMYLDCLQDKQSQVISALETDW